ncbi:hypothetical protein GCM10011428_06570 [Streptomyces violaceus]
MADAAGRDLAHPDDQNGPDSVPFDEPVTLGALRAAGTFHPPQSHSSLKSADLRQVSEAGPAVGSALRRVLPDKVQA